MRHIGVVVNPIAGMGGRVGLKGTDGKVEQARSRGAEPRAPERARAALESLGSHAPDHHITTVGGEMGASAVRAALDDVSPTIVDHPPVDTTADDTRRAVTAFLDRGVDLVLFVGGDGTAVDVAETISAVGCDTPMLGVPAGVKIYSSVFAVTPRAAGRIAATYDRTERREVNDIDEERYRSGEVHPELKAVVSVPVGEEIQPSKQLGGGSVDSLAAGFTADVDPGTTYVFGPGSTVRAIERQLGIDGSPLGIDVWRAGESSGELLVCDGSETDILDALGEHNVVVVSPIGGQGFVFGRGNQQLSPAVIRHSEVVVVASNAKLDDLGVLRVDTDDPDLDEELRGWQKVRVGRFEHRLLEIV
ncbi:ATP-NAD kinase family protein [Halocatena salina]|uniref:ATP-NAD kinase family protein n=1 Tax=Halocatena salina TaxID=2934340 RepID=A0A8U0A6G8_9EURY|nr:ATP-NAD kinase family protein [Halocatena salina]UPM44118.1 ATP-NAD kinase family protein [Halocatena salina]